MNTTVVYMEENGHCLVLGANNVPQAREALIEWLIDNELIDNYGVCEAVEDESKALCNLGEPDLCERCQEFLATVYPILKAEIPTAALWKEM